MMPAAHEISQSGSGRARPAQMQSIQTGKIGWRNRFRNWLNLAPGNGGDQAQLTLSLEAHTRVNQFQYRLKLPQARRRKGVRFQRLSGSELTCQAVFFPRLAFFYPFVIDLWGLVVANETLVDGLTPAQAPAQAQDYDLLPL